MMKQPMMLAQTKISFTCSGFNNPCNNAFIFLCYNLILSPCPVVKLLCRHFFNVFSEVDDDVGTIDDGPAGNDVGLA